MHKYFIFFFLSLSKEAFRQSICSSNLKEYLLTQQLDEEVHKPHLHEDIKETYNNDNMRPEFK